MDPIFYCWDIQTANDFIDSIGNNTLSDTAQNIHDGEETAYRMGLVGTQLVMYRLERPNEEVGATTLYANTGTSSAYNTTNYIPPTVPTEP